MAMQRCEGFFHFDDLGDWNAKGHSGGTSVLPTGGRGGRGAMHVGTNTTCFETLRTAKAHIFHHIAFYTPDRNGCQFAAFASGTDINLFLESHADGAIALYRSGVPFSTAFGPSFLHPGATLLATSTNLGIVRNDTWHQLQADVLIDGSSGAVTIKIDGVTQLTYSGNTYCGEGGVYTSQVGMGSHVGSGDVYYSDLVINDAVDDGSGNTGLLGDVYVLESVSPTDGDLLQWTRSSGAGTWSSHVNQNPQDEDATYDYTSGIGDRLSFLFPTVSGSLGTILAVKETCCVRKDEATTALVQLFTRSDDNVNHDDATVWALTEDYIFVEMIKGLDPKDSSSWTAAKVNATDLGIVNVNA